MSDNNTVQPIIKRIKKVSNHGSHGGAWKIAYADFVTAMMAFFLLLWLLSVTTDEQKAGIADYFSPSSVSKATSGAGGILAGKSLATDGARGEGSAMVAIKPVPEKSDSNQNDDASPEDSDSNKSATDKEIEKAISEREEALFQQAELELKEVISNTPELSALMDQIIIDRTPEGMRIQIVDHEGLSMFKPESAVLVDHAVKILRHVAKVIATLPNRVAISGHTDNTPFYGPDGHGNWELSAERANAGRRVLMEANVPNDRIMRVSGRADAEPLFPDSPDLPGNRRISIILLREASVLPPSYQTN